MTNNADEWTNRTTHPWGSPAHPDPRDPALNPPFATVPMEAHTDAPAPTDAAHNAGVALHPRMRLALDELLDTESAHTHNLAILVGRVRRVPARRTRAEAARPRAEAVPGRFQITDYGIREDLFRLEIQEVAGDELDSAVTSYSMDLAISHRLLESGLFEDGQRLAICGALRMERTYDARFATTATDPGRPDWTTKLEVLTMLPVDDRTPDGSFVELIGVVEGAPRIRREPIGAGVFETFATVRLRCRRQLRSSISRSRAVFSTSTVLPLDVPLNGDLADAGALLRDGNTVHIHGRLVQYRYQLPVRAPTNAAGRAERKGVPEVLDEIAATARNRLAQRQPQADAAAVTREIRRAQQRFLTVIKPTIEVGYVELRHGAALDAAAITELMTHWRPRPTQILPPEPTVPPPTDAVIDELDMATAAAVGIPSAVPSRPRRRVRAADGGALDTDADRDAGDEQERDHAA